MKVRLATGLFLLTSASIALAQTPEPHALFAAERAATGGEAWNAVAAIAAKGTLIVGDAPSSFNQFSRSSHRLQSADDRC